MTAQAHPYNITGKWPAHKIMTSLAKSGWGDLDGRSMQGVRSTLRALTDLLPWGSAQGMATAPQIADAAGLSERWVRRWLGILEDADVIVWTRGGIIDGKPAPSYFRVSKNVLAAIVKGARPVLAAIQRERAAKTAVRIAGLKFVRSRGRGLRASAHAALSAIPSPKGKDLGTSVPSDKPLPLYLTDEDARRASAGAAAARAAIRPTRFSRS